MAKSKKNINSSVRILWSILIFGVALIDIFFQILKACVTLYIAPLLRYLIPKTIRTALVGYIPIIIRPIITPILLLIFTSWNRYSTVSSKILHFHEEIKEIEGDENDKDKEKQSDPDSSKLKSLKKCLQEAEDELLHIPGESVATIAGAGIFLISTGPLSIFGTAAATTIGSTLGNLAYETITFAYCKIKNVPNTSALAKHIDRTKDLIWQSDTEEYQTSSKSQILKWWY